MRRPGAAERQEFKYMCWNTIDTRTLVLVGVIALAILTTTQQAKSAENLKLREGISFYQDTDSGFPIVAEKIDDVSPAKDGPTLMFFGASGDLNTNRQARRLVDLYRKYCSRGLKFVIIDVDNADNAVAKQLLKEYYRGYIPLAVLLDKKSQSRWSATGEVELNVLQNQIDRALTP